MIPRAQESFPFWFSKATKFRHFARSLSTSSQLHYGLLLLCPLTFSKRLSKNRLSFQARYPLLKRKYSLVVHMPGPSKALQALFFSKWVSSHADLLWFSEEYSCAQFKRGLKRVSLYLKWIKIVKPKASVIFHSAIHESLHHMFKKTNKKTL